MQRRGILLFLFTIWFASILMVRVPFLGAVDTYTGSHAPSWGKKTQWLNLPQGETSLDITDYRGKVVYLALFQQW
jgi:hypothetical protein